jgi:hypothetical protein
MYIGKIHVPGTQTKWQRRAQVTGQVIGTAAVLGASAVAIDKGIDSVGNLIGRVVSIGSFALGFLPSRRTASSDAAYQRAANE